MIWILPMIPSRSVDGFCRAKIGAWKLWVNISPNQATGAQIQWLKPKSTINQVPPAQINAAKLGLSSIEAA